MKKGEIGTLQHYKWIVSGWWVLSTGGDIQSGVVYFIKDDVDNSFTRELTGLIFLSNLIVYGFVKVKIETTLC
jgi:hypothetical protein